MNPTRTKVLYIGVSCWLLACESHDLSQAETDIIVVTNWENHHLVILWICSSFLKELFLSQLEINQQPTTYTDVEHQKFTKHNFFGSQPSRICHWTFRFVTMATLHLRQRAATGHKAGFWERENGGGVPVKWPPLWCPCLPKIYRGGPDTYTKPSLLPK